MKSSLYDEVKKMKILSIHNDHIKQSKPEKEYGCVCNKCGTVFIFKEFEACIPRCPNPNPSQCTVRCPNSNCQNVMTLALCKEFKTPEDKDEFEQYITNKNNEVK